MRVALVLLLGGALALKAQAAERVFFCIVDQVVGLQSEKSDSGRIGKGTVERFKMTYRAPRIAIDGPDPLYDRPILEANITGSRTPTKYELTGLFGVFSGQGSGFAQLSKSGAALTEKDPTKLKAALATEIKEAQDFPPIGAYVAGIELFGTDLVHLLRKGNQLQGIAVETRAVIPEGKQFPTRVVRGYMYYFTCDDF